jgi:hypothetical protein
MSIRILEDGMKALVVYESMYGNTAVIGEEIAASLRSQGIEVEAGRTPEIDPSRAGEVDLLVVGGPTHVHGMSSSRSRATAVDDKKNTYDSPTLAPGLRDWLEEIAPGEGRLAAAFDTRIDKPAFLTGSAAKGIAKRLERRGYQLALGPECFLVTTSNALLETETHHASVWGRDLAAAASALRG